MLIYCTRGADVVPFGKNHETVYEWKRNQKGDFVCEVNDPKHVAALLQSPEIYIPYGDGEVPAEVIAAMNALKESQSRKSGNTQYELLREFCSEADDNHLVLVRIPHDAYTAIKSGAADFFIEEVDTKEPEVKSLSDALLDQLATADLNTLRQMAAERRIAFNAKWGEAKLREAIKEHERLGHIEE